MSKHSKHNPGESCPGCFDDVVSCLDEQKREVSRLTADLARVTGERDEQKKLRKTEVLAGLSLARQLNETRANLVALDQSKTAQFAAETLARSNAETALSAEREKNAALTKQLVDRMANAWPELNALLDAERARAKGMEEALTELLAAWSKIMTSCELPDPVMAIKIRRRASLAVSGQSPVTGRREACWSRSSPCPTYEHSHEIIALPTSPAKEPKPCGHHARSYPCGKEGCAECVTVDPDAPAVEKPDDACVCDHTREDHPVPDQDCCSECDTFVLRSDYEPAVAPVESLTEDEGCKDCGGKGEIMTACDGDGGPPIMDWEPCPRGCAPGEGV